MQYLYDTAQGKAVLNKGNDYKLIIIGKFKTEADALQACKEHHAKACQALKNLNKPVPTAFFV